MQNLNPLKEAHNNQVIEDSKQQSIADCKTQKAIDSMNDRALLEGVPTRGALYDIELFSCDENDLNSAVILYSRITSIHKMTQNSAGSIASAIFNAALVAQRDHFDIARGAFITAVEAAEGFILSNLAGKDRMDSTAFSSDDRGSSAGAWPSAVRKVKLGFDNGLLFSEFSSLSAVEKECNRLTKELKASEDRQAVLDFEAAEKEKAATLAKDKQAEHVKNGTLEIDGVSIPAQYVEYIETIHRQLVTIAANGQTNDFDNLLESTTTKLDKMMEHFKLNLASLAS